MSWFPSLPSLPTLQSLTSFSISPMPSFPSLSYLSLFSTPRHSPNLLSLPPDLLSLILTHTTHLPESPTQPPTVTVSTLLSSSSLLFTPLAPFYYPCIDRLSLPDATDSLLEDLLPHCTHLVSIILRGAAITDQSLHVLSSCSKIRNIDLSFTDTFSEHALQKLLSRTGPNLRKLLLRKCHAATPKALSSLDAPHLHTLDLSCCPLLTDTAMKRLVPRLPGLKRLALAECKLLSDRSLDYLTECTQLRQVCLRGLPYITDIGFKSICRHAGGTLHGVDVTLCTSLTRDATLRSLKKHCPHIAGNLLEGSARSLRQIIISTLRQNIFIVHGTDPVSKRDTVHTVLIDMGDIIGAALLSSGTTDLSMLGVVLWKGFGNQLGAGRDVLERNFGIPRWTLMD